jgi:hypothetical protein
MNKTASTLILLVALLSVVGMASAASVSIEGPPDGATVNDLPFNFTVSYQASPTDPDTATCLVGDTDKFEFHTPGMFQISNNTEKNVSSTGYIQDGDYSYEFGCDLDGKGVPGNGWIDVDSEERSLTVDAGQGAKVEVLSPTGGEALESKNSNVTVNYTSGPNAPSTVGCVVWDLNTFSAYSGFQQVSSSGLSNITMEEDLRGSSGFNNGLNQFSVACNAEQDQAPNIISNQHNFTIIQSTDLKLYGGAADGFQADFTPQLSFVNDYVVLEGTVGETFAFNDSTGSQVLSKKLPISQVIYFQSGGGTQALNGNILVNMTGVEEGRGIFYEEGNKSQNASLDVVSDSSDAVGRFNGEVNIYSYPEGSEINESTNENFNLSTSSLGTDSLFELNYTEKLFIEANTSGEKYVEVLDDEQRQRGAIDYNEENSTAVLEKEPAPRVKNFLDKEDPSVINGTVDYENGTNASDLKLKLQRKPERPKKFPFVTTPPVKYTMTDENGSYEFTGLQPGTSYDIKVVNSSIVRQTYSPKTPIPYYGGISSGSSETVHFDVTDSLAKLNVSLKQGLDQDAYYAVFLDSESLQSFSRLQIIEPGESRVMKANVGSQSPDNFVLTALKVKYREDSRRPEIDEESTFVEQLSDGEVRDVELGFPERVELSGKVKGESGDGIEGVQVIAENRSEKLSSFAMTNSSGDYLMDVVNGTNYSLLISPGFKSPYRKENLSIDVTGSMKKDVTLSKGSTLEGYVKKDGEPVEGVEVGAWNGSKDSYGNSVSDENGKYVIEGLEKGLVHQVFAEPPRRSGVPPKEFSTTISSDTKVRNITLNSSSNKLSGMITDGSSNELDTEVVLRSRRLGVEKTVDAEGNYSFDDLKRGPYSVNVEPENSSYGEERKFVYLKGDETLDFELQLFKGLRGKVEGKNGDPVQGAYVRAYNYSKGSTATSVTDKDGEYELEVAQVGHNVDIWPEDSGYISKRSNVSASEVKTGSKDFKLSKGVYMSGKIHDPGEKNLSGFISLYRPGEDAYGFTEFENGTYNVTGLKDVSGYNVYIRVEDPEYSYKTTDLEKQGPSGRQVPKTKDFEFGDNYGPKLWVRVEDPSGTRLSNATVSIRGESKKTGSNGIAKFDRQPNNRNVAIMASRPSYNTSVISTTLSNTTLTSGGGTTSVDIHNETMVIKNVQGELVDVDVNVTKNGNSTSEALVGARSTKSGSSLTSSAVTDSSGAATLEDILPGRYLVGISADGEEAEAGVALFDGVSGSTSIGNFTLEYEVPN